jgi:hypothetical protein
VGEEHITVVFTAGAVPLAGVTFRPGVALVPSAGTRGDEAGGALTMIVRIEPGDVPPTTPVRAGVAVRAAVVAPVVDPPGGEGMGRARVAVRAGDVAPEMADLEITGSVESPGALPGEIEPFLLGSAMLCGLLVLQLLSGSRLRAALASCHKMAILFYACRRGVQKLAAADRPELPSAWDASGRHKVPFPPAGPAGFFPEYHSSTQSRNCCQVALCASACPNANLRPAITPSVL